jgi:hypothetical protein
MHTFSSLMALCALSVTVAASQHHPQPQSLNQLQNTVLNSTKAEANSKLTALPPAGGTGDTFTYCQSNPNSQGTTASIGYGGSLILQQHTFGLTVSGQTVIPSSFGMFTYGQAQTEVTFGNGYLCISPFNPGIYRMPTQALSSPTLILAMEDAPGQFAMLQPGSQWNFQFWYRDPQAGPANFNLSNALHVHFTPTP